MKKFEELELLKLQEVINLLKIPRSTIYYLMRKNRFPKPLKLSERKIAWRVDQIKKWLNKLEKEQRGKKYD